MFSRILLIYFSLAFLHVLKAEITNQNVERSIDLSSQLVKESIKITAEDSDVKPIKKYNIVLSKNNRQSVAFISVRDSAKRELKVNELKEGSSGQFTITFDVPTTPQLFYVDVVYSKRVIPHPEKIEQSDKQLVKYIGELYFYSPYKTNVQKLSLKLSSSNLISYTPVKPVTTSDNKVKYGPFENIPALANQTLFVHYENQSPFLAVNSLERSIEVSHWGNIAVKENICLTHSGAKLKGSFSRYEFQKDGRSGQYAVRSYRTLLPASAVDVYYRDSNGNISTSNMKILRDAVELELRPRFPLFGGWKTRYTIGYNVPSFEYLFHSKENYLLKMRIIDHIYDDMVIDEAVVKIILPEGSSNIELKTPYAVNRSEDELFFTYLDTIGRPVVSFSKTNLIESHISDFELKYKFSTISQLQEPILVTAFIFTIFVLTIIFTRLDFSISTHNHKE